MSNESFVTLESKISHPLSDEEESEASSYQSSGSSKKISTIMSAKYKQVIEYILEFSNKKEVSHKELNDAIEFIQSNEKDTGIKVPDFLKEHFELIQAKTLSKRPNDNSLNNEFKKLKM